MTDLTSFVFLQKSKDKIIKLFDLIILGFV